MRHRIIEIKARSLCARRVRDILKERGADFRGIDRQVDTYFRVPQGRLKLREGDIENALIHYVREDGPGPKQSRVTLCATNPDPALKQVLSRAMGVLVVVEKSREIYFIDNVKFHIDDVDGLGSYVEIEAIGEDDLGEDSLRRQCDEYVRLFDIRTEELVTNSYSDMLLEARGHASR